MDGSTRGRAAVVRYFRSWVVAAFLAAGGLLATVGPAHASCPEYDPEGSFLWATLVIRGTPVDVRDVSHMVDGKIAYRALIFTVRVEEVFKGAPPPQVEVVQEWSTVDYEYSIGSSDLLYLYPHRPDFMPMRDQGRYRASKCNSRRWSPLTAEERRAFGLPVPWTLRWLPLGVAVAPAVAIAIGEVWRRRRRPAGLLK